MWHLFRFFSEMRERILKNDKLTLIQSRDAQFAGMTRRELLIVRDECYTMAEEITTYIMWQDSCDVNQDEA